MEYQTLINLGGGAVIAVFGWFARTLWDAVQELKDDLAELRESIPKEYTTKADFNSTIHEIRDMFREIRNSLKEKADK